MSLLADGKQPKLRIAIATLGRFHVLDLARELDALGHEVLFYSFVPKRRAQKYGLPARCHVTLWPWLLPWMVLVRLCANGRCAAWAEHRLHLAVDHLVASRLQPCDIFIGMSGVFVEALIAARQRYAARIVLERGSTHIETQKQILDRIKNLNPRVRSVPTADIARELRGYDLADRIVVPSIHAEQSFLARGVSATKLSRNPYGTDVAMFKPNQSGCRDRTMLLFVGAWSYQKGVDVLVVAMSTLSNRGYRLVHIGSVADAPLPADDWFHSEGKLDQSQLPHWYQRAHCLVLPSRQEGLALVQVQALASGCPIIGSTMSGAADLECLVSLNRMVQVVPVDDPQAIVKAVAGVPTNIENQLGVAVTNLSSQLSWSVYAQRYDAMLGTLLGADPDEPSVASPASCSMYDEVS